MNIYLEAKASSYSSRSHTYMYIYPNSVTETQAQITPRIVITIAINHLLHETNWKIYIHVSLLVDKIYSYLLRWASRNHLCYYYRITDIGLLQGWYSIIVSSFYDDISITWFIHSKIYLHGKHFIKTEGNHIDWCSIHTSIAPVMVLSVSKVAKYGVLFP